MTIGVDALPRPVQAALAWGSLSTLAAGAASALGQWALLVILARFGSPELVGRYALALAVAAPVMALGGLQLRTLITTDARGRFPLARCLQLRWASTALSVALVALAGRAAGDFAATAWLAVLKAIEQFADLYHGLWLRQERPAHLAAAWWSKTILGLGAFAAVLGLTSSLPAALALLAAAHLTVLALYERRAAAGLLNLAEYSDGCDVAHALLRAAPRLVSAPAGARDKGRDEPRPGRLKPAPRRWRPLLGAALPLGLLLGAVTFLAAVPRYFVAHRFGPAALGRFAALAQLPLILHVALGSVGQAATARLAADFCFAPVSFFRLSRDLIRLAVLAGTLALAALPLLDSLAGWLYGPAYAGHYALLGWATAAAAASGVAGMIGTALTAAGILVPQLACYGLAIVLCLTLCGAGVFPPAALAVASVALTAGQSVLLRRFRLRRA